MSVRSFWNAAAENSKYLFAEYFCEPVYTEYDFALCWTSGPAADQWTLHQRHAIGAVAAMVVIAGLAGTIVGGILLGWLDHRDAVFWGFLGMILMISPFFIIRLGASMQLVVHADGRVARTDAVYDAPIRAEEIPCQAIDMCRGTVTLQKHNRRAQERAGLWLNFTAGPVVLVSGSESDVDSYIATMPVPLRHLVRESNYPLYVRIGVPAL